MNNMKGEVHTGCSQTSAQASQPTPYTDMLMYLQFFPTSLKSTSNGNIAGNGRAYCTISISNKSPLKLCCLRNILKQNLCQKVNKLAHL